MTEPSSETRSEGSARAYLLKLRNRTVTWAVETAGRARNTLRALPGRTGGAAGAGLRAVAEKDPRRVLALLRLVRRLAPRSARLAQAEAILVARLRGWKAAGPLFAGKAARRGPGAGRVLLRRREFPALVAALPAQDRDARIPPGGFVVYTALFGDDPAPPPVFRAIPGLRFLCFTGRADAVPAGWEAQAPAPDAPDPVADPARAREWHRILAHRALAAAAPGAEGSVWLAPGRSFVGNVETLLNRWCLPHDLVLWRHEQAADWQDLAEAAAIADPASSGAAAGPVALAAGFEARGLPRNRGAWDTGVIWRRHDAAAVIALMEGWWRETDGEGGNGGSNGGGSGPGLAEMALCAALLDEGALAPRVPPLALGTARDNIFTAAVPAPGTPPAVNTPPVVNTPPAPALHAGPRKVAIVYAEKYAQSASTFLRGRQLGELVSEHCAGRIELAYTSDADSLRDHVVVLTKGALETLPADRIGAIGRRNAAVLGSWDDMIPDPRKVAALTGNMTLSHRQTVDFARLYPETPSFHVTHHVNRQIRPSAPPGDRLRAGYFGFLRNTWRPESLKHMIDFVPISTAKVEMNWIDRLPHYNCHWIVRRRGKVHDGWKPFLKGFVAARCGAVVAIGQDDDDAMQYLGDDYPFYVRAPDPGLLEYDMYAIMAAFGGPEWRLAQEIMAQVAARSSDEIVAAEFLAMVEAVS